ncbi:beta-1,6-N-acetylglucosaminyltransferase [Pseudonocardia sp.]|uniref:beta-1,6-N-acetylglucosaminyltransferase n=1 Tax=Pseudonocardia sp. TaxID=60912 RepID=UPI003D100A99
MPVFAVLAHAEPQLLARLVDRLAPHPVIVHIDARSPGQEFAGLPRTVYVRDRVPVRWGGFSVVEATVRLFETAVEVAAPREHVVLLSGQCYPARPVKEFADYLDKAPFRQHCHAALLLDGTPAAGQVLRRWYFDHIPVGSGPLYPARVAARRTVAALAPRRRPDAFGGFAPVAGSQWIALTADCVADLLERAADERLVRAFRHTQAPDETFFQTLLWSSRWRAEVADPELRPRSGRVTADFANYHYVDRSLLGIRTIHDLPMIEESGKYFVRKVSAGGSAELLDALDARIRC